MKAKKALQFLDRRILSSASSLVLLLAMAIPAVVPAYASAANLTTRSITMSSSVYSATSQYEVKFTTSSAAGAFVVDFCSNSPIYLQSCTAPTGMDVSGVGTSTGGATTSVIGSGQTVEVVDTLTASQNVDVTLTGIKNPSAVGAFYARVVTFDTSAHAAAYTAQGTSGSNAGETDWGGIALSTTNGTNVSAAVLESMTFCMSGAAIAKDCSGTLTAPNVTLGQTVGTTQALDSGHLSTGSVYTQISTNAVHGAIVNMKSDATGCGGLVLVGGPANNCYIKPAIASDGVTGGAAAGSPFFGLETLTNSTASTGATDPTGELIPETGYGASTYFLNYVTGDATGITSTYGDPLLYTNSAPANNQNQTLTFAASVDNTTPAGNYSANMNLIATGTF